MSSYFQWNYLINLFLGSTDKQMGFCYHSCNILFFFFTLGNVLAEVHLIINWNIFILNKRVFIRRSFWSECIKYQVLYKHYSCNAFICWIHIWKRFICKKKHFGLLKCKWEQIKGFILHAESANIFKILMKRLAS